VHFLGNHLHLSHLYTKLLKASQCTCNLTCKGVPFKFGPAQIEAQADLKEALLNSPALQPINYNSDSPFVLVVDTLQITVGFYLCQADLTMPKKWYYARFRSLQLNDQECCFSQLSLNSTDSTVHCDPTRCIL
jgi:hypothetical protein